MIFKIKITTPYITLGQLLKLTNTIANGGMSKVYLQSHTVLVNTVLEIRRGRKLYPSDLIVIDQDHSYLIVQ